MTVATKRIPRIRSNIVCNNLVLRIDMGRNPLGWPMKPDGLPHESYKNTETWMLDV